MRGSWLGQTRTTGLLALVCLGLSGVIYIELDEPPLSREARSMPTAAALRQAPERSEIDVEFEMPPLAVYGEIAARPLFSPTRQPPPPEEAAPVEEEEEVGAIKEAFALRGIAMDGTERVALLERRATGELRRTLEGQTVDGWRLATITSRSVAFTAGEREQVLEIEKNVSPPMAPPQTEEPRARRELAPRMETQEPQGEPVAAEEQLETEAEEIEIPAD